VTEDEEREYAIGRARQHVVRHGRSRTVQVLLPFDQHLLYDIRPAPDEDVPNIDMRSVRIGIVHFDHHGEITRVFIPPRDPDAHL